MAKDPSWVLENGGHMALSKSWAHNGLGQEKGNH